MSEPVPAKRGRKPDPIYGKLVELFVEGGSEVFEIDWRAMGRKPDAVQQGLNAAIKRLDLGDTLRVSLLRGGEQVLLRRRAMKLPTGIGRRPPKSPKTTDGSAVPPLPGWVQEVAHLSTTLSAVCFVDASIGWVAGADGEIWRTGDGGLSWKQQHGGTDYHLYGLDFADTEHGWAAGQRVGSAPGVVLCTSDGGVAWHELTPPMESGPDGISLLTPEVGWILGGGSIHHTKDSGRTWRTSEAPGFYGSYDICFTDEHNGWIVGDDPLVAASTDGGLTWVEQDFTDGSGGPECLMDVRFMDREHGWAVGWHGALAFTSDAGENWGSRTAGPGEDLRSVFYTSTTDGWAVGGYDGGREESGLLLHSTDGGTVWKAWGMPSRECLNDVFFIKPTLGWAVGKGGIVLRITPPA